MNRDGTNQQMVVGWRDAQIHPQWSPDGDTIIFASGGQLWTVAPDGSGATELTRGAIDGSPSWRRRP